MGKFTPAQRRPERRFPPGPEQIRFVVRSLAAIVLAVLCFQFGAALGRRTHRPRPEELVHQERLVKIEKSLVEARRMREAGAQ